MKSIEGEKIIMIKDGIKKVSGGQDLERAEMIEIFNEIMSGTATDSQIGSFLTALHIKGETIEEITGAAIVMRKKSTKIFIKDGIVVDTCGTGGSGTGIFNISTVSALILAAQGLKVAKHGNRSATSKCGSADVLEKLGVNINLSPDKTEKCINEIGIGFMFAPLYHSAMKYAIHPRKEIGIRTIFNILGPITNPASAKRQVLGVFSSDLTEIIATVLKNLGSEHCMIVNGANKIDEITLTGETKVSELKDNEIKTYNINPSDFGFKRYPLSEFAGGSVENNAAIIKDILSGNDSAKREIVLLNAAAGLVVGDVARDLNTGIDIAKETIDSGDAMKKLSEFIKVSNTL